MDQSNNLPSMEIRFRRVVMEECNKAKSKWKILDSNRIRYKKVLKCGKTYSTT